MAARKKGPIRASLKRNPKTGKRSPSMRSKSSTDRRAGPRDVGFGAGMDMTITEMQRRIRARKPKGRRKR